jgi:Tfp pilus assembly protein PilO
VKDLANKLIVNLHWFVFAYAAYTGYGKYEEHQVQMTEMNTQVPTIEADIAETEKKVKEIQEFVTKTEEYKVRVEEVAKNIESVQKQLPAEINDNSILSFFTKEMEVLNIRDANIQPGSEVQSVYFITKDYSIKAKGTFLQFLIFFERIGNATRIYNVKSLKLVQSPETQKGRFQLVNIEAVVQAFRFNPDFKVDRGFEQIEGSTAKANEQGQAATINE